MRVAHEGAGNTAAAFVDGWLRIGDSGVVGDPDARLGALVHVFIESRPNLPAPLTEQELIDFASERLAAYKVPDRWTFVESIPATTWARSTGRPCTRPIESPALANSSRSQNFRNSSHVRWPEEKHFLAQSGS